MSEINGAALDGGQLDGCGDCEALRVQLGEATDAAAYAQTQADMWKGIGLGAWIVAALVVLVAVAVAVRGAAGQLADAGHEGEAGPDVQ